MNDGPNAGIDEVKRRVGKEARANHYKAVELAVNECRKKGILSDFFKEHSVEEIEDMLFTELIETKVLEAMANNPTP